MNNPHQLDLYAEMYLEQNGVEKRGAAYRLPSTTKIGLYEGRILQEHFLGTEECPGPGMQKLRHILPPSFLAPDVKVSFRISNQVGETWTQVAARLEPVQQRAEARRKLAALFDVQSKKEGE